MRRFPLYLVLVAATVLVLGYALADWATGLPNRLADAVRTPGYADCGEIGDDTPTFSHDGREVAFVRCGDDGTAVVRAIAATGGESRRLFDWKGAPRSPHERQIEALAWSADGRIAFVTGPGRPSSIYVWSPDTNGISTLGPQRKSVKHQGLAWSPDGRYLSSVTGGAGDDPLELVYWIEVTDTSTGRVTSELARADGVIDGAPAWSADGSEIAFLQGSDIRLRAVRGDGPSRIVKRFAGCPPAWVEQGVLAHVDPTDPGDHLVLFRRSGRQLDRELLPRLPSATGGCPTASATGGRRLAYVADYVPAELLRDVSRPTEIWIVDMSTDRATLLVDGSG